MENVSKQDRGSQKRKDRTKTVWHSHEANISDSILLCLQTELDFNPMQSANRGGKLTICLFV